MPIYNDIVLVKEDVFIMNTNTVINQNKKKKYIKSFDIVGDYINIIFSDYSREHINMEYCHQLAAGKEKYLILNSKQNYYILHLVRHKLIDNVQT